MDTIAPRPCAPTCAAVVPVATVERRVQSSTVDSPANGYTDVESALGQPRRRSRQCPRAEIACEISRLPCPGHALGRTRPPAAIDHPRPLYLVLESLKDGKTVYRDNNLDFQILPAGTWPLFARFCRPGRKETQGDWRGKYGRDGHEVAAVATLLPTGVQFDRINAGTYTWETHTGNHRAGWRRSRSHRRPAVTPVN